jgi:hypothetical protein
VINRTEKTVQSFDKSVRLNYEKGLLILNAPDAQGISGNLAAAGETELADLTVSSTLKLGHIVMVSLDNQPIASSAKMLLQVMSEEKPAGFVTEPAGNLLKIVNIGHDPWMVKNLDGKIRFKRANAKSLRIQPLDFNGYPAGPLQTNDVIALDPATIYYSITR